MNFNQLKERLAFYRRELKKKQRMLILAGIGLGILMGVWGLLKTNVYTAETTFHPDSGDGGAISSLGDPIAFILGGGRGRRGGTETAQIMEVLKSRHLSELVAEDTVHFEGKDQLMADLVLETVSNLFGPYYLLNGVKAIFLKPDTLSFSKKKLVAGRMLSRNVDITTNENGFLELQVSFFDAKLLEIISNLYIDKLTAYYQNQQTEKAKANLKFYTHRADSVEAEINKVNKELARYVDQSGFSISARSQIKRRELELRLEFLAEMYKPLILSKEQAISQLQKDTPIIQVLDPPLPPFKADKPSPILHFLTGFLIGFILLALFSIRKPLAKDIGYIIRESLKDKPVE